MFVPDFGDAKSWPDAVNGFHRTMWRGEFDAEMLQVSSVLPSTMDTNPQAMGKRLREQLVPLHRLYLHMEESKSVTQFSGGAKAEVEKTQKEEDDNNNLQDAALKGKLDEVEAGDVTSSISDFGSMTVQEKKSLVSKLNKDAIDGRTAAIQHKLLKAAANIVRHRVRVFTSGTECKRYMESTSGSKLQMRLGIIDCTMPTEVQTGAQSRRLCKEAPDSLQADIVADVRQIPTIPIVSSILVRTALHSCYKLFTDLEATHPHKRSLIVPIDIPLKHLRYLHSAALRAKGPDEDCRSGVDFHVRTIGHGAKKKNKVAVDGTAGPDGVDGVIGVRDDAADEDPDDLLSDGEPVSNTKEGNEIVLHDPATMTMGQLMKEFGESQAAEITQVQFQHSNRICPLASFRDMTTILKVQVGDRGAAKVWRKGQVDPSVFFRAIDATISSVNVPITTGDAFVNFTGGTPECLSAAMAAGFLHAFVIMPNLEATMMMMPTEEQELTGRVRYDKYESPDPEQPSFGVLAAECVRHVAQFIHNYIDKVGYMRIEPPEPIEMPSLKTFFYFQVTDQIVARTVVSPQSDEEVTGRTKSKKPLAKGVNLPAKGGVATVPTAPTVKGKLEVMSRAAYDGEAEDDDEEVGDGVDASDNLDEEMAALEAATRKNKRKIIANAGPTAKRIKDQA